MNIILKIFKTIFYILVAMITLIVLSYYLDVEESRLSNGYYKDYGSGVVIKSEDDEKLFIGGVLDYSNNKRYIIAKVFPRINYICEGFTTQYFITKIKYLIIDTQEHKVYGTNYIKKFKKKMNNLNIKLGFNISKKELNAYIKNNNNWFYKNEHNIKSIKSVCKEENFYTTKKYTEL